MTADRPTPSASELDRLRLIAIIESTDDAIVSKDLDGTVRSWNPGAERIFGYSAEEMVDHPIFKLIPPELHDEERMLLARIRSGEHIAHYETERIRKDGARIRISLTLSPLRDKTGKLIGASVIKRDVTTQRALESQVQQAQRMEAIGRLAGGVAHEINNALQGALGFASFALRRLDPQHPARADVVEALKASERAATITQGLLAIGRRQVLQPSDVSLGVVVEEFTPMLRQALGRDRELELELPPAPLVVHADRGQLEQVLLNFALNARDAMRVGGRFTVQVGSVALAPQDLLRLGRPELAPGPFARLSVTDTGHGMDEATLERVFEPFFTTKRPGQGTGLGLAVVHGIVHQSGGAIDAWSEPERGSTFTVYLPLSRSAASRTPSGQVRVRGGAERLLVVDDEPIVLQFASRLFEEEGYTVTTATDGADALRRLSELDSGESDDCEPPVDLVVSDIIMPVMGGRELGDVLARRYPDLPVLFTSGHPGEEVIQRGLLAEGAEFIQKPFRPESILVRVRALLDRVPTS